MGLDGVEGIFHFFVFLRFLVVLRFSSLFFILGQGQRLQFTAPMGNFTPTPSAPTPCKSFRI